MEFKKIKFCYEFKKYLSEAALSPRGLLKTTTTKQYFDHFKFLIKTCFLKKFIKEELSKKIYVKNESTDLQNFITINEIKTLIQNAFDDAVLIGCDEKDFKNKILELINEIEFSLGRK